MKPHPSTPYALKVVRWGGAGATLFLLVLWLGTIWFKATLCYPRFCLSVTQGGVLVSRSSDDSFSFSSGISRARHPWSLRWYRGGGEALLPGIGAWWLWEVFVPLWAPLLAALCVTGCAWTLDSIARRRAKLNRCPICRYDRTGLTPSAVCPECGAGAPQDTAAQ